MKFAPASGTLSRRDCLRLTGGALGAAAVAAGPAAAHPPSGAEVRPQVDVNAAVSARALALTRDAIVIDAYTDTPVPTEKLRRALGDNSEYLHAVDLFLAKPKPCTITAAHTCAEHPAVTP